MVAKIIAFPGAVPQKVDIAKELSAVNPAVYGEIGNRLSILRSRAFSKEKILHKSDEEANSMANDATRAAVGIVSFIFNAAPDGVRDPQAVQDVRHVMRYLAERAMADNYDAVFPISQAVRGLPLSVEKITSIATNCANASDLMFAVAAMEDKPENEEYAALKKAIVASSAKDIIEGNVLIDIARVAVFTRSVEATKVAMATVSVARGSRSSDESKSKEASKYRTPSAMEQCAAFLANAAAVTRSPATVEKLAQLFKLLSSDPKRRYNAISVFQSALDMLNQNPHANEVVMNMAMAMSSQIESRLPARKISSRSKAQYSEEGENAAFAIAAKFSEILQNKDPIITLNLYAKSKIRKPASMPDLRQ